MLFPVRHRFQERVAPPDTEQGGVFGRTTLRTLEGNNLAHNCPAFPFWEAQPDGIAVLIESSGSDEGAISLALYALFGVALPDTYHRIKTFLLLFPAQLSHRACV